MANLVPCKSCKHEVAPSASKCPNCGVSHPGMTWKAHLATGIFLVVLVFILMKACSEPNPAESLVLDQAVPYTIISTDDFSFPARKRIQVNISAEQANDFESYAQTAVKAAVEMQQDLNADVIYVFLGENLNLIETGAAYAIARYAPDNGGNSGDQGWTWQVEAVDKPFSDLQIKVSELWWQHRDDFQVDGLTDEDRFVPFLAEKLGVSEDQIQLPFVLPEKYEPKRK